VPTANPEHQRRLAASLRLDLIDLDDETVPDVRPVLAMLCELAVERLRTTCPATAGLLGADRRLTEVVAALLARRVVSGLRPESADELDRAFLEAAQADANPRIREAAEAELAAAAEW